MTLACLATPDDTSRMSSKGRAGLDATLARLRERFLATSGETVARFEALVARLAPDAADAADAAVLDEFHRELHRTHGTSGSYGFHAASRLAGGMEALVGRWIADPSLDAGSRPAIARGFTAALAHAFGAGASSATPAATPIHRLLLVDVPDERSHALVAAALVAGHAPERVAPTSLETVLREGADAGPIGAIIAGSATVLPAVGLPPVTRMAPADDPRTAIAAALSACCGPPP